MTVLVRADASPELGSGHVVRCANLATRLQGHGHDVHFVCADITAALDQWLHSRGFDVHTIGSGSGAESDLAATMAVARDIGPVDLVVVDHYGLDARWESGVRPAVGRLMVVDDLADRVHACDYLLDPTPVPDAALRYAGLVPDGTRLWLGPQYALLREEFDREDVYRERSGDVRRLVVFLGGGVTSDSLLPLMHAIVEAAPHDLETRVLLGYAFPDAGPIVSLAEESERIDVVEFTDDVIGLFGWADLAIGACGGASWERCAVGLPAVAVVTASNQLLNAAGLERAQAVRYLGPLESVTADAWRKSLSALLADPTTVRAMARATHGLTRGRRESVGEMLAALTGAS